jgi:SAM-dependent methyltransferase
LHYFEQHPELFAAGKHMVHIAPEPELRVWLSRRTRNTGMRYQSGGITGVGEEYLDLRQLPFADGTIDLIYCCHVLNAMQDDRAAMRELCRVLHPQGVALLQVPAFYSGPCTLETNSRDERLAAFHDEGIYRCYTDADYVARLQDAGFDVEHYRAEQRPPTEIQREQLKAEVLHVCRRRGAVS